MTRSSSELAKLEIPSSTVKTNEIADIYKNSTLLLNVYIHSFYIYIGIRVLKESIIALRPIDQLIDELNFRFHICS